jgi:hypothetical protein
MRHAQLWYLPTHIPRSPLPHNHITANSRHGPINGKVAHYEFLRFGAERGAAAVPNMPETELRAIIIYSATLRPHRTPSYLSMT